MLDQLDQIKFAENAEARCPCVLVVDVSDSMNGEPIAELNKGLRTFKAGVLQDPLASKRVEIAIVTFGSTASVVSPFTTADEFAPPQLRASGLTAMGQGIVTALDLVAQEKAKYRSAGIAYYRPWVFLITDGQPTDSVVEATRRVHEEDNSEKKGVSFFAVGVQGANMEKLRSIVTREPVKLAGLNFEEMFLWLSSSLQRNSSARPANPSQPLNEVQVPLQPLGWTTTG
jgi:uncharacterized protein YegL